MKLYFILADIGTENNQNTSDAILGIYADFDAALADGLDIYNHPHKYDLYNPKIANADFDPINNPTKKVMPNYKTAIPIAHLTV